MPLLRLRPRQQEFSRPRRLISGGAPPLISSPVESGGWWRHEGPRLEWPYLLFLALPWLLYGAAMLLATLGVHILSLPDLPLP